MDLGADSLITNCTQESKIGDRVPKLLGVTKLHLGLRENVVVLNLVASPNRCSG